ncbi:hypothetical protein HBO32_30375 [Pseudomonas nitroreducens]|uniref:hypothetical protein n=1 Tax=Pseudomonas nitroreducens TaxID=46680 RepID=UPI0014754A6E|nr:hypothetical protein [Pseudomonas nitroreducens]NMZ77406.1 hypothetical protein [Pseudomonas nitroreducens]
MSELFAALKSGGRHDFSYTKEPICPHCGNEFDVMQNEAWELYEEGEHEVQCNTCDENFSVNTHVKFSFSTDEQDED